MKEYFGIDNGVSGAIAAVHPDGKLDGWLAMPIQKTRKGNEVNIVEVRDWIARWIEPKITRWHIDDFIILIEEPGGSKSARAATSMAGSFHSLRAMCELMQWRWQRITPQSWQKPMLHCKGKDTKPAALTMARSLWPKEKWLETEGCRVAHDGAVDAALIAEFGRRNNL